MKKNQIPTQTHLFVKYIADLPLRHQRELMERPFFSLSKQARHKPIEYKSPDGKVFVRVTGGDKGIATIYDQDFIIGWTSMLIYQRELRANDISRTLRFYPQDLLETIHRDTGGREYQLARDAMYRLATTKIETNIRTKEKQKYAVFNWIDAFTDETDRNATYSHGMTVSLSDWLYEGITMDGGVLKLNSDYFNLTGAYERWLYQLARKHAGGAGPQGFTIAFTTLYEKSGSGTKPRAFKYALMKIVTENILPDFHLHVPDSNAKDPILHITHRHHAGLQIDLSAPMLPSDDEPEDEDDSASIPQAPGYTNAGPDGIPPDIAAQLRKELPHFLPVFLKGKFDDDCRRRGALPFIYGEDFLEFCRSYGNAHQPSGTGYAPPHKAALPISDAMLAKLRSDFPAWDLNHLYGLFDAWIKGKQSRPANIEKAFYSFVQTHAQRNMP
ncbi:MAG: replication initiator protein A [Hyphomicrobium sp.]|jgi:plasmid replication initiation protein